VETELANLLQILVSFAEEEEEEEEEKEYIKSKGGHGNFLSYSLDITHIHTYSLIHSLTHSHPTHSLLPF